MEVHVAADQEMHGGKSAPAAPTDGGAMVSQKEIQNPEDFSTSSV